MADEIGEHRVLGEQRVDPLRAQPFEAVSPEMLALKIGLERRAERVDFSAIQDTLEDHEALGSERVEFALHRPSPGRRSGAPHHRAFRCLNATTLPRREVDRLDHWDPTP